MASFGAHLYILVWRDNLKIELRLLETGCDWAR